MTFKDPNKGVEERREEIIKDLTENKTIWETYKEYKEKDIHGLISFYALQKSRLEVLGNYTQRHHEYVLNEWNKRAWFALAEIQHKKLFDLQCRWRAKELEIAGFDTSHSFEYLSVPILDLPIIPDITEEEIDMYRHYLKTPNGASTLYYSLISYQNHDDMKSSHEKSTSMIPYYEYHNTMTGNTRLLLLPDLIGQEEERLIHLALDYIKKKHEAKEKPKVEHKPKFLYYHKDQELIKLALLLGEKNVAGFIKDCSVWVNEKPTLDVEWAIEYLSCCYPEPVPMIGAPTWQAAIENTVLGHITEKVSERLPIIYEEYQLKKQLGTPIGYIETERPRDANKPLPLLWMEIGKLVEKGIEVNTSEFFNDRKWE